MVLRSQTEIQALWDQRADEAEIAGVEFLKLFRTACPGLGEKSWYLHCIPVHIPDCIRKFGRISDYSTEFGEAGHSWTNKVLVNASNSIPGERMLQVMTAKTTEERVLSEDKELQQAVQRTEKKRVKNKETRVKAAKARAAACIQDIQTVLGTESQISDSSEQGVKQQLNTLKRARREAMRASSSK